MRLLPRESATAEAMVGEAVHWGLGEQLLAAVIDALNMGNWQRGGDKRTKKPKPIPRPGVRAEQNRIGGGRSYSIDEIQKAFAPWRG